VAHNFLIFGGSSGTYKRYFSVSNNTQFVVLTAAQILHPRAVKIYTRKFDEPLQDHNMTPGLPTPMQFHFWCVFT